ncbi:hypothetical protein AB7C87_22220 [Natrarchaeobius sp. A-rgal3]|uniref:hypothetical protein n=1 Tax=Natrarchaeobius versutus TaxID=1679078 RepID=UPI00350F2452
MILGAAGLVATAQIEAEVEQDVEGEFANAGHQEASTLESWDEQLRLLVTIIAESTVVTEGNESTITPYLADQQSSLNDRTANDFIYGIHYADVDSGEILASSRGTEGDTFADRYVPAQDRKDIDPAASEQQAASTQEAVAMVDEAANSARRRPPRPKPSSLPTDRPACDGERPP